MKRPKRKQPKPTKYDWGWVVSRSLYNGVTQWECYIKNDPAPAGFVWGIACGITSGGLPLGKNKKGFKPVFQVFHSFVHPWARRKGVRTRLMKEMQKHYTAIFTYGATKDGDPWMRATNYKKLRPWGLWIQDQQKPKPKTKRSKKKK